MRGLLVIAVVVAACLCLADGKGECGATPPDKVAQKLAPCASAGKNPSAAPSSGCCSAVHTIGKQSPECLCAVMLSKTARKSGIRPEVAITIPKRCNLADRPVGYKCGGNQFFLSSSGRLALLLPFFASDNGLFCSFVSGISRADEAVSFLTLLLLFCRLHSAMSCENYLS
jgi:hypothetical protein